MQHFEQLAPGQFYHIYNCGINGTPLYIKNGDYDHFLLLYDRFIDPIADTFAWCLMGNHFHLLVRIKENVVYKYIKPDRSGETLQKKPDRSDDAVRLLDDDNFERRKWETISVSDLSSFINLSSCEDHNRLDIPNNIKIPVPHLHFSHLFNAYSKYFNKKYCRHGSLFERPFKRKLADDIYYLKQLVLYIHKNPVHHRFVEHPAEYPWSSYLDCVSVTSTKLQREKVVGWFDSEANFILLHDGKQEVKELEEWLEL